MGGWGWWVGVMGDRWIGSVDVPGTLKLTGWHMKMDGWNTLPETNSWPLKIDPWKRRFLLETTLFRGYVSFKEGTSY